MERMYPDIGDLTSWVLGNGDHFAGKIIYKIS